MRSIGHLGVLAVAFALLLSPMALMLESAPGELERSLQPRWTQITEQTPVDTPTSDSTPDVVVNVDGPGSILFTAGGCDTSQQSVTTGWNWITIDSDGAGGAMTDGTYSGCVLTFTNLNGNETDMITLTTFVVDTTVATPTEHTPVSTPTHDMTPDVVITTTEAGTIVVAGTTGCGIGSAAVASGQQTLTLSTITQGDGVYTCTITFTDSAGNEASALTLTSFEIDTVAPTVVITSSTVSDGGTTGTAAVVLTYTTSEVSTNFDIGDVTVTDCVNTAWTFISSTVYGSTCTAGSDGTPTIIVAASTLTDAAGNENGASNTYDWTYDSTGPTMTIASSTVSNGGTTGTSAVSLTFTSSEATTDFAEADITATGCTLSGFTAASSTVYMATCTAFSGTPGVLVAAGAFNDETGNDNSVSNTYQWTYLIGPAIVVVVSSWGGWLNAVEDDNDGSVTVTTENIEDGQTVTVTINSVQDTCTVSSNTCAATIASSDLRALTDGMTYTIYADVTDASGDDAPQASSAFQVDITAPTVVSFALSDTYLTAGETATVTLVFSEAIEQFISGVDVTCANGILATMSSGDDITWTGAFTPYIETQDMTNTCAVGTSYTDYAGNMGGVGESANYGVNTGSGPTMAVSSGELSDGEVTASNSVNLTFTSSAATIDFTESDVYANHCAISDFTAVTADTYTATCTAPSDGSSSISVIGGVFSDEFGGANFPSNTFTWTYDGTGPSMTITSTEVSSGDTSGDPAIWLTFASNEPTTDFTADDIAVTNGVLSAFTPLVSTQYMAMLTPLTMGEVTVVEVGAWTYHDAVGNSNTGAQFLWTYLDLDSDNDGISDHYDPDDDNDGIMDIFDDLPLDPTDSIDTDGDGVGNTADEDDDGDGWTDDDEVLCGYDPIDSSSNPYDTDGDGTCDSIDADNDGDGVVDTEDAFPQLWNETVDTDGDGSGDNADLDDDGDEILDADEIACISDPLDRESVPVDTDGDGICDVLDGDADGDTVPDSNDAFPLDSTQWKDDDSDGLGDNPHGLNSDPYPDDRDNDGYPDIDDPFPLLATPGDKDNDGISDTKDVFPADPEEWEDFDEDGVGDNADPDDDGDGWSDIDELREGTNPYDADSEPITTFQIVLPGTWGGETVALDAWDLVGILGGGPIVLWLAFSFTTRNSRTAKVERRMKSAKTREELTEIAERTEYLLMLRLLGVHQGIKLERIRAELDDVLEARDGTEFGALDQTPEVEKEVKEEEWSKESTIDDLESLADDLDELYELTKE